MMSLKLVSFVFLCYVAVSFESDGVRDDSASLLTQIVSNEFDEVSGSDESDDSSGSVPIELFEWDKEKDGDRRRLGSLFGYLDSDQRLQDMMDGVGDVCYEQWFPWQKRCYCPAGHHCCRRTSDCERNGCCKNGSVCMGPGCCPSTHSARTCGNNCCKSGGACCGSGCPCSSGQKCMNGKCCSQHTRQVCGNKCCRNAGQCCNGECPCNPGETCTPKSQCGSRRLEFMEVETGFFKSSESDSSKALEPRQSGERRRMENNQCCTVKCRAPPQDVPEGNSIVRRRLKCMKTNGEEGSSIVFGTYEGYIHVENALNTCGVNYEGNAKAHCRCLPLLTKVLADRPDYNSFNLLYDPTHDDALIPACMCYIGAAMATGMRYFYRTGEFDIPVDPNVNTIMIDLNDPINMVDAAARCLALGNLNNIEQSWRFCKNQNCQ